MPVSSTIVRRITAAATLVVGLAALSACTGPYDEALDSKTLMRPQPMSTPADQRALAPYDAAPYFRGR